MFELMTVSRILGPVLMGWGISRRKVYKTLLALAKQAVVKDENTEKPVKAYTLQLARALG